MNIAEMITLQNDKLKGLAKQLTLLSPEGLGSQRFIKEHNLKFAYVVGGMVRGISSVEMITAAAKAGILGFYGTGGCQLDQIQTAILAIKENLPNGEPFGMNLLCNLVSPRLEEQTVDLYLKHGITIIEAAAYLQVTEHLVYYRVKGTRQNEDGSITVPNKIIAKLSRPEVAVQFLSPPPEKLVKILVQSGKITKQEAELSAKIPMASDITAEANSGGHTDNGVAYALIPAIMTMRDGAMEQHGYPEEIRVGAAGGLGTPHAILAAFMMGVDYVVTGSINQCTVEAGISDQVKDLLADMNIQDTEFAPAGDMFELGAKVQVLKKGVFFPARANKLFQLYKFCNSVDEIDAKTKKQIENNYFKRSFDQVYEETKEYFSKIAPLEIEKAEKNPKHKMALIFRWYFYHTTKLAFEGDPENRVDYQVHCSPALGSFNQWVKGSKLEKWRNRHVDEIAEIIMYSAAYLLNVKFLLLQKVKIPKELLRPVISRDGSKIVENN
ncbi:dioxygenases related to 2-nitropropane dioxygenase [Candidatus Scalindua japonica]|uniref:Dioxygenases related to 2-nitropropane dioxygenase n=1 Tax=Candidatus Scalindua japonica TaxID=1284222 RepID=A0A286TWI5_9BACT|nr:PfaD family polyunsaturated fatty acid/polyketide biosynthesis protein [Candidatus Scalindua japonica]GAX60232.1 dioxygenases related to 2-nitropropane dioxygenase [Candidatus Scalindua japonica]